MPKQHPNAPSTSACRPQVNLKVLFREKNLKLTPQRYEIYKVVSLSKSHPCAEDVHKKLKRRMAGISFDTVYRTLSLFEKHGLIGRVHYLDDKTRYDPVLANHHHFICCRCKKVIDIDWPDFDQIKVPGACTRLGRVLKKTAELRGICSKCLGKKPSNISAC